jgi:two-component system sensor histidine kinase UhpB
MGKLPDPNRASMNPAPSTAMDLPRLVMRRAIGIALVAWLSALVLGLHRAGHDMKQEVAAADTLARLGALLARASHEPDDARVLADMKQLLQGAPLRHLQLQVRGDRTALLIGPDTAAATAPPLSWLLQWHRAWVPAPEPVPVRWMVPRDAGRMWVVELRTSYESERIEAIENLAQLLLLAGAGSVAMLLAMGWNVRHAFKPMRALLQAIGQMRGGDATAMQRLPAMPIAELQSIAAALGELGVALEAAEQQRRALSRQVLTLQDDERQRIARELHDEFGQRLTALRADAAWLSQQLANDTAASRVVQTMAAQCEALQSEIRALLRRLQPADDDAGGAAHLLGLQQQLAGLVQAWRASPGLAVTFELVLSARDINGHALPWPDAHAAGALVLPRELSRALYRISQEALTNVARHARATRAALQLTLQRRPDGDLLHWQVSDDGQGLGDLAVALQRGNGLAGIRQRVWALGADLECDASRARGACLRATFRIAAMPALGTVDDLAPA